MKRNCFEAPTAVRLGVVNFWFVLVYVFWFAFAFSAGAERTIYDPNRPVSMLGQKGFTVQWYTAEPCATRLQLREGGEPCMTWKPEGEEYKPWEEDEVRLVEGGTTGTYHRLTVTGLNPCIRYYYRLYDPGVEPTPVEVNWGAEKPWGREYAVNTLSPDGCRTVVRIPVKVLVMPNVYSMYNVKLPDGTYPELPPVIGEAEKEKIVRDFKLAERFWFVNNGFRVWYDLQIFWDERPQYWGEVPEDAPSAYKALVPCRSFSGQEYRFPGGGTFTIVDLRNIEKNNSLPVEDEFVGQIENAQLRYYDAKSGKWLYRTSGGGTFGVTEWFRGVPGRSQFLGDDIAWLTCHEYHHQIESLGTFSGLDREDDHVIYDHFVNRHRFQKADGEWDETTWDLSAKCGDHWSGIAMTDRKLTDLQWLRMYFGTPVLVVDRDMDGVPDGGMFSDGKLPFTEAEYGYDENKRSTDGVMDDFSKVRESIWSGGVLQPWFARRIEESVWPNPVSSDSDDDGLEDAIDPLPLLPFEPYIWPLTAEIDGDAAEWVNIPLNGEKRVDDVCVRFKQGHDESAYYALIEASGEFTEILLELDGEGHGIFSGCEAPGGFKDYYEFRIRPDGDGYRITKGGYGKGADFAYKKEDGKVVFEFSIENRGESSWFWKGGGREVGSIVSFRLPDKSAYTLGDGYQPVYCFMLPSFGVAKCPVPLPSELKAEEADVALDFSRDADLSGFECTSEYFEVKDGALNLKDDMPRNATAYLLAPGFKGGDFTAMMEFEAKADAVLGAFESGTAGIDPGKDSVGFLGGYGNKLSKIRLKGLGEVCEKAFALTPGRHTMQFQRKGKYFFLICDGREIGWYGDNTKRPAEKIGLLGCAGSDLKVYRLLVKGEK